MVSRDQDAFHGKRSAYRITEPLLAFYDAIMRPAWTDLERPGHAEQVWSRSQATFRSKVLGPHFEPRPQLGPLACGGRANSSSDATSEPMKA